MNGLGITVAKSTYDRLLDKISLTFDKDMIAKKKVYIEVTAICYGWKINIAFTISEHRITL